MGLNELLANLILFFHFAYVLGVIIPIPCILLGAWRNWTWVRWPWLRNLHLGMILLVVFEAILGMICPLTEWEAALRRKSGTAASPYPEGFLAAWVSKILFSDFEAWVYTLMYVTTALIVIDLYILIPPRKNQRPP